MWLDQILLRQAGLVLAIIGLRSLPALGQGWDIPPSPWPGLGPPHLSTVHTGTRASIPWGQDISGSVYFSLLGLGKFLKLFRLAFLSFLRLNDFLTFLKVLKIPRILTIPYFSGPKLSSICSGSKWSSLFFTCSLFPSCLLHRLTQRSRHSYPWSAAVTSWRCGGVKRGDGKWGDFLFWNWLCRLLESTEHYQEIQKHL